MTGRMESNLKTEQSIKNLLMGMPEYMSEYYYWLTAQNILPKTCLCYIRIVRNYLEWINTDMTEISFLESLKYPSEYLASKARKKIYNLEKGAEELVETSISSRKTIYYALKNFYDFLENASIVAKNPIKQIKVPAGKDKVSHPEITEDNLNDVLLAIKCGVGGTKQQAFNLPWINRDLSILGVFIYTGMRESELCEINIGDIGINEDGKYILTILGKGHTEHEYDISQIMPTLTKWMEKRTLLMAGYNGNESKALFISNRRQRISPNAVYNIVKKYTKAALGVEYSPHKIRSAFCNIVYKETGDIKLTCNAVGHVEVSTTMRYLPEDKEAKYKAANIMGAKITL